MPIFIAHLNGSKTSMTTLGAAFAGTSTIMTRTLEFDEQKVGVMFSILFASLFAVSFPTLSKQIPFLRIPGIVFFVGKHFGTGVILATAFIHLLDDAFQSLQDNKVAERYGAIGKFTGLIILVSLLSIFLVEYTSTSYVEHLHNKPSAPPTPTDSPAISPRILLPIDENTPLLPPHTPLTRTANASPTPALHNLKRMQTQPLPQAPNHQHHHSHFLPVIGLPIEVLTNSPRICRLAIAHDHFHGHHSCVGGILQENVEAIEHMRHRGNEADHQQGPGEHEHDRPKIGRRRQVIGLLVLQLGIMIHSLVIGLTLSVTYGSDFTSLTTAIIFHQIFEGLSLGVRIASLPPVRHKQEHTDEDDEFKDHPSHSPFRSGLQRVRYRLKHVQWMKPVLTLLFGVTTPFGMCLGMVLWGRGDNRGEDASMLLIQGIMSAISAGMLIYAATVEMIAGDFVFGDVEGHHHHHHHHESEPDHEHGRGNSHSPSAAHNHRHGPEGETDGAREDVMRQEVHGLEEGERAVEQHHEHENKASIQKRILAVISLFAGAGMMVLVGLGE